MKHTEIDLLHGPLVRDILRFSVPLMLTNVLQVLFNMSDIAVVGRFAGAEALGSVGSTAILVTLYTGLLLGMASGVNVTAARCIGAGRSDEVADAVHTSFAVSGALGMLLLLVCFLSAEPVMLLLGTKDVLLAGAVRYLRIYALGMPAMALYNWGAAVLGAGGDTRRPLAILTCAGIANILLNLFFVIAWKLGTAGVALASALSQLGAAAAILRVLLRREDALRFRPGRVRVNRAMARNILRIGIPSGLQNAVFAFANLFIQGAVNTFDAVTVEGNSAALNADGFAYDIMAAVYTACAAFMSCAYGAGDRERVRRSYRVSLACSFAAGAVMGLLLLVFGRQFLFLFTDSAAVVDRGLERLRVMAVSYAFSAFMDCTIAASRGIQKTAVPTVIVLLGSCVFRIIWIYTVFAHFRTLTSLYLLYIFSWTITAAAEIVYFRRAFRRQMPVRAG